MNNIWIYFNNYIEPNKRFFFDDPILERFAEAKPKSVRERDV